MEGRESVVVRTREFALKGRGSVRLRWNHLVEHAAALAFLWNSLAGMGQVVAIPPVPAPTPEWCHSEEVEPNLVVRGEAVLTGRLFDQTGAPFDGLALQLRNSGERPIRRVKTDKTGRFDFGKVKAGHYRLVAMSRAWQQPTGLACDKRSCSLHVVLRANPTDLPYAACPPR